MLSAVAIFAVAVLLSVSSDDSSAAISDGVRVYVQNEDGTYTMTQVDNVQTVLAAVQAAMADQGRDMTLNITRTNIRSVDGRENDPDHYWRVFQWLPPGTAGWGVQTFSPMSNERLVSGTTYCVNYSTMTVKDGTIIYSPPTFKPVSEGYVFIRFANGFSPDDEHVKAVFTPEIREQGFWLRGEGSDMGEVLTDAVERNWPGEIELMSGDVGGNNLSGWVSSMFGLGDVNLGNSVWSYWSQWTWVDNRWNYNEWTLGYYDPAVYRYMEVIYLISTPDPYGDGYIIDKGGPEPDPVRDGVVCIDYRLNAEFRLDDGTPWGSATVNYGDTPDASGIPEPVRPGYGFVGWGDVTGPMFSDTVFTAEFVPVSGGTVRITYRNDDGSFIRNEYVDKGSPATYPGVPTKKGTVQFDYAFDRWDKDLSSVTEDTEVMPIYTATLKRYEVRFHDHDRSFIEGKATEYGTAAELPPPPSRAPTVKYRFVFRGWSLTPNNYIPLDLDNITGPVTAFAYYEPTPMDYTLTFREGDSVVGTFPVRYGMAIGGRLPMDLFKGEYIAKMYRDAGLTRELGTNHIIVGDTTVYVKRVLGSYDAERDPEGNVTGNRIYVTFDAALAGRIPVADGKAVICDISQFPNGTAAVLTAGTLRDIRDAVGGDTVAGIIVPRGSLSMRVSDLIAVLGDGDELSYSVGNGPSSVKIYSALKKLNYDSFYRLNLRSDGLPVMDLKDLGIKAEVSLPLQLDEGVRADVWNITSAGTTTHIVPRYDGRQVRFDTDLLQFYAVGTTDAAIPKRSVIVPYGGTEAQIDVPGTDGSAGITSVDLDNMGDVFFIPSSVEGSTVRRIGPGALNGLVNARTVVVPYSVSYFSWTGWNNNGIQDIYFNGPCPMFDGTAPGSVTVHYDPSAPGWDASVGIGDMIKYRYDGSYKKDTFAFLYYLAEDRIVVDRYIHGTYVSIPGSIAVDGTEYPVSYIGDSAFMFSKDPAAVSAFGLRYSVYRLETVELNISVKELHTRSFLNSTVKDVMFADAVVHIWDEAFDGCRELSNMRFSEDLVFIGRYAFRGCDGRLFTRAVIPDSVSVIGDSAFYGCSNITNVEFGNGLAAIPRYCFGGCVRLTELNLSDSIVSVGDHAFYNCTGLLFVDLNKVSSVGARAFYSASATSSMEFIILGEDMRELGKDAFGNNTLLTEVEVHCPYFEGFEAAFGNVDLSKVTFFATDGTIASWSAFNVVPLKEPEVSKDTTLLRSVEIGLVVFFVMIGAVSFRRRSHRM